MRKTIITIILSLTAAAVYAQNAADAYLFSENQYEGTARSLAMGNAFTALGGDLGSVTINPAGSAVSGYSQLTITPSFTFSSNTAEGKPAPGSGNQATYFQEKVTESMFKAGISNAGLTYNWETGRKSGLKSISFGFVYNQTNSWSGGINARGTNAVTSFMGAVANTASLNGLLGSELGLENAYNSMPWREVAAYQSGMISNFGGMDDMFVGASEDIEQYNQTDVYDIFLAGPIRQTFNRNVNGNKKDFILNFGGNISDFIYFGANLGFTSINYSEDWYLIEEAINQKDFGIELDNGDIIFFQKMKYTENYTANGSGVYGKVGVIVTPGYGLRFGAAIQTPTITTMTETWTVDAETQFSSGKYSSYSPFGDGGYTLTSPMRANFGLAYTHGKLGLISVDYEMTDYSQMKYDTNNASREHFSEVNTDIRNRFGISHMVRAGLEIKPLPTLAVRAGYSLTTSGEIWDSWGTRLAPNNTQTVSFGLGYSSKGSFFADAAVQTRFLNKEFFMPYEDYTDVAGNIIEYAPEIAVNSSLWKAVITFGWRF